MQRKINAADFIPALCGIIFIACGIYLSVFLRGYKPLAVALFALAGHIFVLHALNRFPEKRKLKMAYIICACVLAAALAFSGALAVNGGKSKSKGDSDYCIVLGCGVHGNAPSYLLSERINAAYEFLNEYPEAKAILCGGKGSGENISEAECMARELEQKGIDAERLITEDKSTSTSENLINARALLGENTGSVTLITSDYHIYRAVLTAQKYGINALGYGAKTGMPVLYISQLLRETVAIWYYWFFM